MKVVLLLVLVASCVAQLPKPCASPMKWEGKRIFFDESRPIRVSSRVFYDAEGKQVRDVEEVEQGVEKAFYDVLRLYSTSKEYRLNIVTKKCNVSTLTEPFRPVAIPDEAIYLFANEVGPVQIPLEHITAYGFTGNFSDNVEYMMVHTFPNCVPIEHIYIDKSSTTPKPPAVSRYYGINVGMFNASNFEIPAECL